MKRQTSTRLEDVDHLFTVAPGIYLANLAPVGNRKAGLRGPIQHRTTVATETTAGSDRRTSSFTTAEGSLEPTHVQKLPRVQTRSTPLIYLFLLLTDRVCPPAQVHLQMEL